MARYHQYVFDVENRQFIGQFEEMYQQERLAGFDSWHQEDNRQLNRQIALTILGAYNFNHIIDLGCGKGALTHRLKKHNNRVLGIDISQTALDAARARFPDIDFAVADVNNCAAFAAYIGEYYGENAGGGDLVFSAELFSYLENWKDLLALLSTKTRFLMITLYLPEDPIGFVKTPQELEESIANHFEIIESVSLKKSRFTVIFAKTLLTAGT